MLQWFITVAYVVYTGNRELPSCPSNIQHPHLGMGLFFVKITYFHYFPERQSTNPVCLRVSFNMLHFPLLYSIPNPYSIIFFLNHLSEIFSLAQHFCWSQLLVWWEQTKPLIVLSSLGYIFYNCTFVVVTGFENQDSIQ